MRNGTYSGTQSNGSYRPQWGNQGSGSSGPRFKKMEALYPGKCLDCPTELKAGDVIYYSRQDGGVMCAPCGMHRYEPHLLPKVETASASAYVPVVGMPLTLVAKCYCAQVRRTCGFCVAKSMEARAKGPEGTK